jgi:ribosomal protein S18 acetylase RimI-like enzyme
MDTAILMRRDLREPFAEPSWPDGISLVPFSEAMSDELYWLLVDGYAKGEGSVGDYAQWWTGLITDREYDAELLLVAQASNGKLIGLCHCWNSSFIKDLVVAPGWRRSGTGEALLLRAFQALSNRYHHEVRLKVHCDNLGAIRLYRRLGFTQERALASDG